MSAVVVACVRDRNRLVTLGRSAQSSSYGIWSACDLCRLSCRLGVLAYRGWEAFPRWECSVNASTGSGAMHPMRLVARVIGNVARPTCTDTGTGTRSNGELEDSSGTALTYERRVQRYGPVRCNMAQQYESFWMPLFAFLPVVRALVSLPWPDCLPQKVPAQAAAATARQREDAQSAPPFPCQSQEDRAPGTAL